MWISKKIMLGWFSKLQWMEGDFKQVFFFFFKLWQLTYIGRCEAEEWETIILSANILSIWMAGVNIQQYDTASHILAAGLWLKSLGWSNVTVSMFFITVSCENMNSELCEEGNWSF